MVLVLAVVAVLILVPLIVSHSVINEAPLLTIQVNTQKAEAAAEAGIQHYRNLLDNIPNYWVYNATNLPQSPLPSDLALETTNGTLNGPPVYNPVTNGSTEAYHYVPSTSCIQTADCSGGPDNGDIVLLVTGRAGGSGRYSYESLTATFKLSGILNDAYYSEYELLDPNVPDAYPMDNTNTYYETSLYPSGTYSQMVMPIASLNNSLFMDLCGYHTYEPNTYIDSLNSIQDPDDGHTYNSTHPYYGPFFGSEPIVNQNGNTPSNETDFVLAKGASGNPSSGALTFQNPCNQPFNFKAGESFGGTVYTNDQIYTDTSGGNPSFLGTPPLDSGAKNSPASDYYAYDWPGSKSKTVSGSTVYYPAGWIDNAGGDPPTLSYATEGPANQTLPQFDTSIRAYADGQSANGCLFTGPTMIEFVKPVGSANSTMNVWSPLTRSNSAVVNGTTYTSTSSCGTYSPSSPWQTGLALPSDGVIYVQSVPAATTDPNYWATTPSAEGSNGSTSAANSTLTASAGTFTAAMVNQPIYIGGSANVYRTIATYVSSSSVTYSGSSVGTHSSTYYCVGSALPCADATVVNGTPSVANDCLNPYTPNWSSSWTAYPSANQCPTDKIGEGDVIVEGELHGEVTLASDANVVQSRDITYSCADGSGTAVDNLPSACVTSGSVAPDLLGIAVDDDLVLSHPTNDQSGNGNGPSPGWVTGTPGSCGSQDGTTLTATISAGASASTLNSYVAPTCDIQNPILDAAVVALGGALGDENYDQEDAFYNHGTTSGGAYYINGTDISFFRGPFGTFDGNGNNVTGYNKNLDYDSRLGYATPPYFLGSVSTVWNLTSVVVCGSANAATTGSCTEVH